MTTKQELAKAVRTVLDQRIWPEYRTQDDNGLEAYEYVEFITEVLAALRSAPQAEAGEPSRYVIDPNDPTFVKDQAHRDLIEKGTAPVVDAGVRAQAIEECLKAALDGFESAMESYALIGPSGMAMRMINSIRALSDAVTETSK